jgi:hypothetical protein
MKAPFNQLGEPTEFFNASTRQEIDAAFELFVRERPDLLFRQHRHLFQQSARSLGQPRDAPRDPDWVSESGGRRNRRVGEPWIILE